MQMKQTEIERKSVGRQMSTEMRADDVGGKCGTKTQSWDFPGGSVAGTLFLMQWPRFSPWSGN